MQATLEPVLRAQPFLAGLREEHLALLTGCARNVRFVPGEFLMREGEQADVFYILRSGRVSLEIFAPGHGTVMVETVGDGDVVGWSWLSEPFKSHLDVRALELTRAIALDAACLRGKFDADHDFGYELYRRFVGVITSRLQATRLQLLQAVSDDYRR
jgi:CRP/FNR family transcriptional regulator, cyclic AMP receptor protein